MFFAVPSIQDPKITENRPENQSCSGALILFTNTTGGTICRIIMKWQLTCACKKKDLYF